jgi:hypothetical protein
LRLSMALRCFLQGAHRVVIERKRDFRHKGIPPYYHTTILGPNRNQLTVEPRGTPFTVVLNWFDELKRLAPPRN